MAFRTAPDTVQQLVRELQEAEDNKRSLIAKADKLSTELKEAKTKLSETALAVELGKTDSKAYDKLTAKIEGLERELKRTLDAQGAASEALAVKQREHHAASLNTRKADAERLANERLAAFIELATAYANAEKAWRKVFKVNRNTVIWGGPAIQLNHGGCMLAPHEVVHALKLEIARISSGDQLSTEEALPGAQSFIFGGNPKDTMPLIEAVKAANAVMIERIVAGGLHTPQEPAKPKKLEPVENPNAQPAVQDGAVLSAADVMAMSSVVRHLK